MFYLENINQHSFRRTALLYQFQGLQIIIHNLAHLKMISLTAYILLMNHVKAEPITKCRSLTCLSYTNIARLENKFYNSVLDF